MNRFARQAVALLLCASVSTLMLAPVAASPLEADSVTVLTEAPTDVSSAPGNAVGAGPWEKMACIGCMAVILAASGTGSIAAVAVVAGAAPQLVGGCVLGCAIAFGFD